MRILFCANPEYFQHLAVAAASVIDNARGATIDFHVLTCDRDPGAEAKLEEGFAGFERVSLRIHHVDERALGGLFVDRYLTKECYLRLLAAEILPSDVEKVIYLDCDVVVLEDLRRLWAEDLGGKLLAAAPDYPRVPLVLSRDRLLSLGIPAGFTYMNSGVLVIDLARWRQTHATERLLAFVRQRGSDLALHDQDAINAVLFNEIKTLDCRWNLQARMYRCGRRAAPHDYDATREARRRPAIIHYTGSEKPWLFRSRTSRKRDYLRYLRRTPWRDAKPVLTSRAQSLEYSFDRLLSSFGIDVLQLLYYAKRVAEKLGLIRQASPGSSRMPLP